MRHCGNSNEFTLAAATHFSHVFIRSPEIGILSHNAAQSHELDVEQVSVSPGDRTDPNHPRNTGGE